MDPNKKTGGALCSAPPEIFQSKWLQRLDVRRLQALGAADDFEFNRLAIVQRLIAISHNRGEMDENVLTALALDESKALAGVKPLHCSLFFAHCCVSFQDLSYLVLRYVLAAFRAVQNKKAARVTLRTFYEFQRRYKSNKRNKTVPRLAIYSKGNRTLLVGKDLLLHVAGVGGCSPEKAHVDARTCGFVAESADREVGVARLFFWEIQGDAEDAVG